MDRNHIPLDHNAYKPVKIHVLSDLEESPRKSDVMSVKAWWRGGFHNGSIDIDALDNYLHGAIMFCDEHLTNELGFLKDLVELNMQERWLR